MSKKMTLEEANERLKNRKIILLNYDGILKPADARCLKCGNEWRTQANVILNNSCGCPKCQKEKASNKLRFTKEKFLQKYNLQDKYEIIGEYKNVVSKTIFKCKVCGFERITDPNTVIKFPGCTNCNGTRRLTQDEYIERIDKSHSEKYTLLSKFESLGKKVLIRHEKCGNEFWTNALNFIGTGKKKACNCPYCSHGNRIRTQEEFEEIIRNKTNSRFKVISKYNGNLKTIELQCSCGCIIKRAPYYLIKNEILCPKCDSSRVKMSLAERKINDYLVKKNVNFSFQRKFKNCRDVKALPFDFAIEINNNEILLEYDGEQHYKYSDTGPFNYERYLKIKHHDNIKNDFCKNNKITLIRIPYWDFNNIEKILDKIIEHQRSTTIENTEKSGSE